MLILHYNYFNVWYRTRVAHCTFEITLSQAITLTLLLVCSFSPKVQSIFWGPRICDSALSLSHCDKSLFCEHVFPHGYKSIPRGPRFFPRVQKYPAGVLCGVPSGGLPQHRKAVLRNDIEYFVRKGTTAVIYIQSGSETFSLQKIIY